MSTAQQKSTGTEEAKETSLLTTPLWRNSDYLLLWGGQLVSLTGSNMTDVALPLLVLAVTGSPAQAGFIGAIEFVPRLVLSLPIGVLVDRWNRKYILLISDVFRALCLISIPLASAIGHLTILQLYFIACAEGTATIFSTVAQGACLPRVVAKEHLPQANAQTQANKNICSVLGSPLGGLLYSLGRLLPFSVDAVSYTLSALSVFCIKATLQSQRSKTKGHLLSEMKEGVMWLWGQPRIRWMSLLTCVMSPTWACNALILIVLLQRQGASPQIIGVILACAGVGCMMGIPFARPIQKRFSYGQVIISVIWIWTLCWFLYALAPNPLVLALISLVQWSTHPAFNAVQGSHRLSLIPDRLQGRVNSAYELLVFSLRPLWLALAGVLLQFYGPLPAILVFGGGFVVMAVATTFNRDIRWD